MNPQSAEASILIVDDTPTNLRLLAQLLIQRGYRVRAVNSGARAIESATANPPDLILLDVMMPDLDGFAVCSRLKAMPATADIPIIFVSALDTTTDKLSGFRLGGVDYVTKPFQFEEVLARVQTHLALRALQKAMQQQIAERDRLIAELDAFAHTVAHDLKNPLTLIMCYTSMLEGQLDGLPLESATQAVRTIEQTCRKMDDIIEELMLLTGVRKKDAVAVPLDMGVAVSEAIGRLAALINATGAKIGQPARWPRAMGYEPWVEEVWANYISNACKYGGRPPRIEVGGEPQPDGMVRFWVWDNGDGLTPEQQNALFVPFTRLAQARATGHGLGLSIVQRIVDKLGGQVGVQSDGVPGQGCLFYFTLRSAQGK